MILCRHYLSTGYKPLPFLAPPLRTHSVFFSWNNQLFHAAYFLSQNSNSFLWNFAFFEAHQSGSPVSSLENYVKSFSKL